jgi:hypothetical protein
MNITFEDFWNKLVEDDLWWDRMKVSYARKDWRKAGEQTYDYLLTEKARWEAQDYSDFRRIWMKKIVWLPYIQVKPQLQQEETKPISTDPKLKPLEGEERKRRIKEWEAVVLSTVNNFNMPKVTKKQAEIEGQWDRKGVEYHRTPDDILIMQDLIKKSAAEFYKDVRYISGFTHFPFGEFTVFAASAEDAQIILDNAMEKIKQ